MRNAQSPIVSLQQTSVGELHNWHGYRRGAPGPTRTDGLRIRSPTLYPAELRAQEIGVSEGTRTLDHWGHNPVLYPTELHSPPLSFGQGLMVAKRGRDCQGDLGLAHPHF